MLGSVIMSTLVVCDFFTKQITTPLGFRTAYCLFFIHLGSRKVFLTPAAYYADESWMLTQAHDFSRWCQSQGIHVTHLIRDRDKKYPNRFDVFFEHHGTEVIQTPVQAPNANALSESWVATVKSECLNRNPQLLAGR